MDFMDCTQGSQARQAKYPVSKAKSKYSTNNNTIRLVLTKDRLDDLKSLPQSKTTVQLSSSCMRWVELRI